MGTLKTLLHSGLQSCRDGTPLPPFPTHSAAPLFAWLVALRQRPQSRHLLVSIVWGGLRRPRSRSALSTATWRLRRQPAHRSMMCEMQEGGDV